MKTINSNKIKAGMRRIEKKYKNYFDTIYPNLPEYSGKANWSKKYVVITLEPYEIMDDSYDSEIEMKFQEAYDNIKASIDAISPTRRMGNRTAIIKLNGSMFVPSPTSDTYEVRVMSIVE
jgi:hypothetical protein